MELALYCPVCGYYEKEADTVGRRGDFYTNVSVGSLFGRLLAEQFSAWLAPLQSPPRQRGGASGLTIVEAGAHDGSLAADVLCGLRERRPQLFAELDYCLLEPSPRRRQWQQRRLEPFGPRVRWCEGFDSIGRADGAAAPGGGPNPPAGITGIIFSNELLDAFPVHRLGWDAAKNEWHEWGVTLENGRFAWARMNRPGRANLNHDRDSDPSAGFDVSFPRLPDSLLEVLPDGFTIEVSPAAEQWWLQAAGTLKRGKLLTIDYGLAADEFLAPGRRHGTLRAYRRHQVSHDLLAHPGEQDLTAHVNFTAIQRAGESAGLITEIMEPQATFLTRIAGQAWRAPADFGEWTPAHTRQFQTLIHPEHLGRSFRVLVQAR